MQQTANYVLKKPEQTDIVNIEDLNGNFDTIDTELKKVSDKANLIQTAGGTGTAITLTNVTLTNGFTVTFVVAANNSGAATTINTKPLYKPGGTTTPTLTAGKAVTVWYNGTNFFIKASAEGNAGAGTVLAGYTFSNDDDTGIAGSMTNRGAINQSLGINGTYAIPAGYHNGSGQVTQSIPTKAAATITPGTADQTIAAGQYLSGVQTVKGDADLVTGNIRAGVDLFGVTGKASVVETADATAVDANVLSGLTYYRNGAKGTGTIPSKAAATITPGTSDQPIAAGQYLSGAQTVKGDANLVTGNIKSGISIFGVTGKSSVVDTADATAIAGEILAGDTAYVNGSKVTGTMTNRGAVTITPSASPQAIPAGYHNGSGSVAAGNPLINGQGSISGTAKEAVTKGDLGIAKKENEYESRIKLANPTSLPTYYGRAVRFSPDGVHLVIGYGSTLLIYKRNVDNFDLLPSTPAVMPTGSINSIAFSPDGVYMMVGHETSPYMTIYKRVGDTFTKLANPSTLPPGTVYGVAVSPEGTHFAVTFYVTSPAFYVYNRSGDTFTRITTPTITEGYGINYSGDGKYLAIGSAISAGVTICKRSGNTYTVITPSADLTGTSARSVAFSPDSSHLMFTGGSSTKRLVIFKITTGDVFTKLDTPSVQPTGGSASDLTISSDGVYVSYPCGSSPYYQMLKRDGDSYSSVSVLPQTITDGCDGAAFSPDGVYLALVNDSSPYLLIFKAPEVTNVYKYLSKDDLNATNLLNFGFANTTAAINNTVQLVTLPI